MSACTKLGTICALVLTYTLALPLLTALVLFWFFVSWLKVIWQSMNWEPEWPLDYQLMKTRPITIKTPLTEITSTVDEEGDVRR